MFRMSLLMIVFLFSEICHSQIIQVINRATLTPVSDVYIYHESEKTSTITQEDGSADISAFPLEGKVIFQHPGYNTKKIERSNIKGQNFQISLIEKIFQIDELVVTANRWEQDKDEVAQDILNIQPKNIIFQNPQTSADLLSQSGEVFVQKSQLGGGSPMLRGFSANSVLLVVDGIRLNNAIYRSGNLQNVINIDANVLDGAEVIYGPGSVMYGSDAMGGVMDFHTRKLSFSDLNENKFSGRALTRYSSASDEKSFNTQIQYSGERIAAFASVSMTSLGDLRTGKNRSSGYQGYFQQKYLVKTVDGVDELVDNPDPNTQGPSNFDLINTIGKIAFKLSEENTLTYGFHFSTTSDIPRYDRLITTIDNTDSLVYGDWHYGPQKWMMHNLQFTSFTKSRFYNKVKLSAGYQQYEESRIDRRFGSTSQRTSKENVDLYTFSVDFDKEFERSSIYYGLDFFHNQVLSDAYREDIITNERRDTDPRYPDGGSQYSSAAAYLNFNHILNDKWTLNMGGRYSYVRLSANTSNDTAINFGLDDLTNTNQALNGMMGIIYKPNTSNSFKALASSGFRTPNVDDIGKLFEQDDDIVIVPNTDLKPEFSYNQELGSQHHFGELRIDAVAYHSILRNAIVRGEYEVDGSNTVIIEGEEKQVRAQVNADQARIFGGSLKLTQNINQYIAANTTITFTEGYLLDSKEPLRHVPPTFGRTSLIYQLRKLKLEVYSEYNFDKPASDMPDSEIIDKAQLYTANGTPGWVTLNLKAQYVINKYISAQIGLENIFDQHYRPYSSGISAPGRNTIFAIRGRF
jgi:hemoglobin/transferrin/lactoferrin receptor protein